MVLPENRVELFRRSPGLQKIIQFAAPPRAQLKFLAGGVNPSLVDRHEVDETQLAVERQDIGPLPFKYEVEGIRSIADTVEIEARRDRWLLDFGVGSLYPKYVESQRLKCRSRPGEEIAGLLDSGEMAFGWSEVAGLGVGRIDFLRRTLEVCETIAEVEGTIGPADVKTRSSRRTLPIPEFLVDLLAEHLLARGRPGAEEYVFTAPDGGPLRASNFRNRVWIPAVKAAVCKVSRSTACATLLWG